MTLLETKGLSRSFGGLQAVQEVDFTLPAGQVRAIIGPNGAGKTTFVSLVSGRITPSGGQILFQDKDITRQKPWRRVEAGIVYTFQITSVFQNLSCFENVALASQRPMMRSLSRRLHLSPGDLEDQVMSALARVGLEQQRDQEAANLPYGHQRLLEVAMGLALSPSLLIMDEPTQGLSESEIDSFCALTREIAATTTVLLIEHNMSVVMRLAELITVMDRGRILAEGTPAEIQADRAVQSAYLGS